MRPQLAIHSSVPYEAISARNDEADTFAASGWSETQYMLGTIMAKIGAVPLAEQNAVMLNQPGAPDLVILLSIPNDLEQY
jgi:hypothetical protein